MKALVIQTGFGLENLAIVERPEFVPGPGQVLVRVRAASLNYRDLLIVKGHYNPKLKFPRVLGSDAAGEVVAVGASGQPSGDRVIGCFMRTGSTGPFRKPFARSTLGSERRCLSEYVVPRGERSRARSRRTELRGGQRPPVPR